jgi:hypothetical protein
MSKVCPGCREIVEMAAAKCDKCGLKFFKTVKTPSSLSTTCLRLGSVAVALAIVMLAFLRLT